MMALFSLAIGASLGVYTMLPLYLVAEQGFRAQRGQSNWSPFPASLGRLCFLRRDGRRISWGPRGPSEVYCWPPEWRPCSWAWPGGRGSSLLCFSSPCWPSVFSRQASQPWQASALLRLETSRSPSASADGLSRRRRCHPRGHRPDGGGGFLCAGIRAGRRIACWGRRYTALSQVP